MFNLGKFISGALVSAAIAIGGVWFVVDQSMKGLQTAIEATNANISNIQNSVSKLIELEFKLMRSELRSEFDKTRDTIQKASFVEPEFSGPNGEKYRIALSRDALPLSELIEGNEAAKVWAGQVGLQTKTELSDTFVFAVAGSANTMSTWVPIPNEKLASYKQFFGQGLETPRVMAELGCMDRRSKTDGSVVFVPKAETTLAGSDGIICFVDDLDKAILRIKLNF